MSKKVFIAIVLTVALFTQLHGKTFLRAATWDEAEGAKWVKEVFSKYEQMNPQVKINVQSITQGYDDKIITSLAGGTPPDLFMWWDYPRLASLDVLTPLENLVDLSNIDPMLVKWVSYNGHVWGIPKDWTTRVIWFNKEVFDKYGVPYPDNNWTWKEFREVAKKLTHPEEKVWGFLVTPYVYEWEGYVRMNGGSYLSPDTSTMNGYLNSKETIEAIEFLTNLYLIDGVSPSPSLISASGGSYAMFESGKVAMIDDGVWFIGYMRSRNPSLTIQDLAKKFGCVFPPHPEGKQLKVMIHNSAWVIPKNSKNKEIALDIIRFLAKEGGRTMAEGGWAFPIDMKIAEEMKLYEDPILGTFLKLLPYAVEDPSFLKRSDWSEKFEQYIADAFDLIMLRKATVEEALNKAVEESEKALGRK
ncbi:ABC transporter substrate-binding protein [Pseudothermotoga elfii]|uniref:ABC transporter substrate-binding protein n=1 Tax=Pseudothermotoga elfii TaxID=38322 RepID=UPI0003F953CC|nr:sugar ABC transporter substrate-binding protein [Pseudothermotoga elfii]